MKKKQKLSWADAPTGGECVEALRIDLGFRFGRGELKQLDISDPWIYRDSDIFRSCIFVGRYVKAIHASNPNLTRHYVVERRKHLHDTTFHYMTFHYTEEVEPLSVAEVIGLMGDLP